jgi:hydrogenase expression/formation protein HypE
MSATISNPATAPAPALACPLPLNSHDHILLGHGSGGRLSAELMRDIFMPAFHNPALEAQDDQATLPVEAGRIAFSTDSFVVKPLFFPGGNIGELAVYGTVNDLAVGGAIPKFLSAAFILEEGLPIATLKAVVDSMSAAAKKAGVQIVTGDTKVVERGSGDQLFINTSGIGVIPAKVNLGSHRVKPGDQILLSGPLGDHGITILSQREGLELDGDLKSDAASLLDICQALVQCVPGLSCMRDLTRGGLSSALNEIAATSRTGMELMEREIPIRENVRGACELFGLDPLYVANEGKLIAFVAPEWAEAAMEILRGFSVASEARIIGTVTDSHVGWVTLRTSLGTERIVDMLAGDQLPRIC